MAMTVKQVKAELPQVPVMVGRKKHWARVSGRLNQFATVTLSHVDNGGKGYLRGEPWHDWQFSWEAVTRAVNTGNPLRL